MKNILVVCLSDPNGDPRPKRMIDTAKKDANVYVLSGAKAYPGCESMRINHFLTGTLWRKLYKAALYLFRFNSAIERHFLEANPAIFPGIQFDLIVCHDLEVLSLAFGNFPTVPVLFDAREYYPRQFEDRWLWRTLFRNYARWLCSKYLARCNKIMTVSPGLAAEYSKEFQVKPEVVMSLPDYVAVDTKPTNPGKIRIIHHGTANPSRRLELMVETARYLDSRFEVHFMLVPQHKAYYDGLVSIASGLNNVKFLEPVPYLQIIQTLTDYDIGFFLCPLTTFNLTHALPNKLFEYIQARLAIVVGKSPDMAEIVKKNKIGIAVDSYEPRQVADMINGLTEQSIDEYKRNSAAIAKDYSHLANIQRITELLASVHQE